METQETPTDPNGFGVTDLSHQEHFDIIEKLKKDQYPDVRFTKPTNPKEPKNQLSFTLKEGNQHFLVDTDKMKVSYQNKAFPQIKEIFNL